MECSTGCVEGILITGIFFVGVIREKKKRKEAGHEVLRFILCKIHITLTVRYGTGHVAVVLTLS